VISASAVDRGFSGAAGVGVVFSESDIVFKSNRTSLTMRKRQNELDDFQSFDEIND
jgi:hypothetical protein